MNDGAAKLLQAWLYLRRDGRQTFIAPGGGSVILRDTASGDVVLIVTDGKDQPVRRIIPAQQHINGTGPEDYRPLEQAVRSAAKTTRKK